MRAACVINQFACKAQRPAGEPTRLQGRQSACMRNLQVATAGEDEEDLWVVDGQQRAAGRNDEHGCALKPNWLCSLAVWKMRGKVAAMEVYPF